MRLATKPGESFTRTGILFSFFDRSKVFLIVSSQVNLDFITSTSFINGTGFMKCIPITLSFLLVEFAISSMEIEDVLDANMVSALQTLSSLLKISSFIFFDSVAASTTKSLFSILSLNSLTNMILFNTSFFSFSEIFSLLIILSRLFEIVSFALVKFCNEMSSRVTLYPI